MPVQAEIKYDLSELTRACLKYGELSGMAESDIVVKQGAKLSFNIRRELRALAPKKGAVRAERLAALASGGGVKVRPLVYELIQQKYGSMSSRQQRFSGPHGELAGTGYHANRTMNLQALAVQKELNLRESGRGFMGYSTPRARSYAETTHNEVESKYGPVLSILDVSAEPRADHKSFTMTWQSGSPALAGMSEEQQLSAIDHGIRETTADIGVYIERKLEEARRESSL